MPTPVEVEAQYERILSLVPSSELQVSCNGVLQGEYTSLHHAVNEVALAFARLKEVREAVTKLQKDKKKSTGCSTSLNEVMDSTMALQREVQKEIEKVTSGDQGSRKKGRPGVQNNVITNNIESTSSSSEEESDSDSNSDTESESDSGIEPQVEEDCRVEKSGVKTKDVENDVERGTVGTSEDSETSSDSESDLDSEDDKRVYTGKALSLNPLTPELRERNSIHVPGKVDDGSGKVATNLRLSQTYVKMVEQLDRMSVLERNKHTPEVLDALKELLNDYGTWQLQPDDATSIMKFVVKWAPHRTGQKNLVEAYGSFSTVMATYTRQMSGGIQKLRMESFNAKLNCILRGLEFQSNADEKARRNVTFKSGGKQGQGKINNAPQLLMPPKVIATAANNQKRAEAARAKETSSTVVETEQKHRNGSSCALQSPMLPQVVAAAISSHKLEERTRVDKGCSSVMTTERLHHCGKPPSHYKSLVDGVDAMPLQSRVSCIPRVLLALSEAMADDNDGQQKSQVIYSVGHVIDWITKGVDAKYHVDMYIQFAGTLNAYIEKTPSSDQLHKTVEDFSHAVNEIKAANTMQTADVNEMNDEPNRDVCPGHTLHILVEELASLSFEERRKRVHDVILAFKRIMFDDNRSHQLSKVTKAMEEIQLWVLNDPREAHLFRLYGSLFKALSGYVTLLRYRKTAELERILARISRALSLPMAYEDARQLEDAGQKITVSSPKENASGNSNTEGIPDDPPNCVAAPSELGLIVLPKPEPQSPQNTESDSDSEDDADDIGGSEAAWKAVMETQRSVGEC